MHVVLFFWGIFMLDKLAAVLWSYLIVFLKLAVALFLFSGSSQNSQLGGPS
jgi:hypothetical protein